MIGTEKEAVAGCGRLKHSDTPGRYMMLTIMTGLCLAVAGCASHNAAHDQGYGDQYDSYSDIEDPLEGLNRATFTFNEAFDKALMEPVARGYRAVVPKPLRTGVRNVLRNLRTPVNAANNLLQGDVEGAAADVSRAMMNTTIGLGGLIDVAKDTGLEYRQEDFGQTLAVWGVGHGPYLVLPFMGPSSFRDATGMLVDSYADPLRLYLYNTDRKYWHYGRIAGTALSQREELLDVIDDLRRNSFDYYAALRSVYVQRRAAMVRNEDPDMAGTVFAMPDYDDDFYD